jgi:cell division ATPase FtsA
VAVVELGTVLLVQAVQVVVEEAEEDRGTQVQDNLKPHTQVAVAVAAGLTNNEEVMALRA